MHYSLIGRIISNPDLITTVELGLGEPSVTPVFYRFESGFYRKNLGKP